MMRIRILSDESIEYLENNTERLVAKVLQGNESLADFLQEDKPFMDSNIGDIDEFDLVLPDDEKSQGDFKNCRIMYSALRFLSESIASEPALWISLAFDRFLPYMKARWGMDVTAVRNRYLFNKNGLIRSLSRQGLARLWWIGRISYDESSPDPYELTAVFFNKQDIIEAVLGRNIFNARRTTNAFLKAINDIEHDGVVIPRETVRKAAIGLNLRAGTYILETLEEEEIYQCAKKLLNSE